MPQPVTPDIPDPTPYNGIDLLAYEPETATAQVVPATVVNIASGTLGAWANPTDARLVTGNGASHTSAGIGNSNFLQCAPAPAGTYDGINDGADITFMRVTFEIFTTRTGIYYPESYMMLMGSNAQYGVGQQGTGNVEGAWLARSFDMPKSFYFPAGISGAQWKSGNFGPGFQIKNTDGAEAGTIQVRAVTMQIFYQNPIPDGGPGLLCEA